MGCYKFNVFEIITFLVNNQARFQFEVNYRFGWRLTSDTPACDATLIHNRTEGYADGSWALGVNSPTISSNATTSIICTAYDTGENWAYGYNSFVVAASSFSTPFTIGSV